MKGDHLDEYVAEHITLVAELEWEPDGEIACQTFRKGLPPLPRKKKSYRDWKECPTPSPCGQE